MSRIGLAKTAETCGRSGPWTLKFSDHPEEETTFILVVTRVFIIRKGGEVVTDQTNKTLPIINALVKAAKDLTAIEIDATNALIEISQLRAKAKIMPVLVVFAKNLFGEERYNELAHSMILDIQEYLTKIGDGTAELSDIDAVGLYGLELRIKGKGLREIIEQMVPLLGRDALNILRIFGLL